MGAPFARLLDNEWLAEMPVAIKLAPGAIVEREAKSHLAVQQQQQQRAGVQAVPRLLAVADMQDGNKALVMRRLDHSLKQALQRSTGSRRDGEQLLLLFGSFASAVQGVAEAGYANCNIKREGWGEEGANALALGCCWGPTAAALNTFLLSLPAPCCHATCCAVLQLLLHLAASSVPFLSRAPPGQLFTTRCLPPPCRVQASDTLHPALQPSTRWWTPRLVAPLWPALPLLWWWATSVWQCRCTQTPMLLAARSPRPSPCAQLLCCCVANIHTVCGLLDVGDFFSHAPMLRLRVAQHWPAVYCSAPFPTFQPCCWLLLPVRCRSMAGSNITVAPEVFVEQPLRISARYDVFALGSMLFEALSGPYFAAREVLGRGWLASMRAVCSVLLTSWFCCHAWPPLLLVPCLPYPAVAPQCGCPTLWLRTSAASWRRLRCEP